MTPIAAPLIPAQWERLWALLRPAVERGGEHTERSVLTALLHGGMVLWTDTALETASTAIVTAWCDYPAGRIGFVLFAGGTDASAWVLGAIDDFKAWGRAMGCKEMRVIGRKGWGKWLKGTDAVYRETLE